MFTYIEILTTSLINAGKNTMSAEEFECEIISLNENIQQLLHKKVFILFF